MLYKMPFKTNDIICRDLTILDLAPQPATTYVLGYNNLNGQVFATTGSSGGGDLQATCTLGNTTTTAIIINDNVLQMNSNIIITSSTSDTNIAIGYLAGTNNPGGNGSIAIGTRAGDLVQSSYAIAIGREAGLSNQGGDAIAIGKQSGRTSQGANTVAVGPSSGFSNQGTAAVAIGQLAGNQSQGQNSIAIGNQAATLSQTANSICLNATGSAQQTGQAGLFIMPVRQVPIGVTAGLMYYDSGTKEIRYDAAKTFVIDHPVDPERYLVHACLEGPESGVYYRGEGKIENESVTITLPDYTTAFIDFTVNLTPIGKCISLATSRVKNGKFEVYGEPCEFFWTVYAKRGHVVVEPLKSSVKLNGDGPYKWLS